jgi:small subunit ribosomal protein S5
MGTGNCYNVVRSTFNALKLMESPRQVAKRRGLSVTDMNERRNFILGRKVEQNVEQD